MMSTLLTYGHTGRINMFIINLNDIAHEIWATAQLLPGEGIENGVARIKKILKDIERSSMEEFIRLNLNGFLFAVFIVTGLIIARVIMRHKIKMQPWMNNFDYGLIAVLGLFILLLTFSLLSQLSVNNIPRREIDRNFQSQSQEDYEKKVIEKSNKEKE